MFRKAGSTIFAFAVIILGSMAPAKALVLIDSTGLDAGNVNPFGVFSISDSNTATYGQTFEVTGSDTHLDSFSLFLRDQYTGTAALNFRGYVAGWNGTNAISILYESPTQTMTEDGTTHEFSFSPNIDLVSGNEYVAFLSISGLPAQPVSSFNMPLGSSIPGNFVFLNNGLNFSLLTQTPPSPADALWALDPLEGGDVWFTASLTTPRLVPEPSTIALFGAGLAGLTAWVNRDRFRRRRPLSK